MRQFSRTTGLRFRLTPMFLFGVAGLLAAQALSVQEFPWIFGKPQGIVAGPDGNLWLAEEDSSKIAQMDRDGNLLREITLPAGRAPHGIVAGPDGRIWFTESGASRIGRMDVSGSFVEFAVGSPPVSIAVGPDGNLWFTEGSANRIGKIDTAGNLLGEFPVPTPGGTPRAIVADPCGGPSLWFTEQIGRIGRIDTAGRVTETANTGVGSNLRGIARGPAGDCDLYVADRGQDCIVKLNPAGQIVNLFLFAIGSGPTSIVAGPDENLWFTENGFNRIGQVTTAGVLKQEVTIPSPATLPDGIAVGPDLNVWFTEAGGKRAGRVFTGVAPPPTPTPTPGGLTLVPRRGLPAPRPFRTP